VLALRNPQDRQSSRTGTSPDSHEHCRYRYLCPYVVVVICNLFVKAFHVAAGGHVQLVDTFQPYLVNYFYYCS